VRARQWLGLSLLIWAGACLAQVGEPRADLSTVSAVDSNIEVSADPKGVIGVHLWSVHSKPGFDDRNVGLYYRWPNGVMLGGFNNSYSRFSAYAGWLWRIDDAGRFGVFLGAATGYGSTEERMPVAPIFAPTVRWQFKRGPDVRLSWFVDPRSGAAQVLHLSVEFQR